MKMGMLGVMGVLLLLCGGAEAFGSQKILLSKVDTLTLRSDAMTKGRRVSPIPQLKCVGGAGKGRYEVDVMRCKNRGSDYGDENISWSCTADLPREFKLGSTDVICEGYDSPDDNYILKGSCGVEYRLALTDYGYEKYGSSGEWTNRFTNENSTSTNIVLVIFWIFFFSVLGWIIYSAWASASGAGRAPRGARNTRPSFWGGGGGGGDGGDPPPPYDSWSKRQTQTQTQGPGFWTGAATGAAAGAAASRLFSGGGGTRTNVRDRMPPPPPTYSGSSWSGGGESSSAGAGAGAGAGERHSSTGFGQTRRR